MEVEFPDKNKRDLFIVVANKGVSFGRTRLNAKPWIFSCTPSNLWEELAKWLMLVIMNSTRVLCGVPPLKVEMQKMYRIPSRRNMQFLCLSATLIEPSHIPPPIKGAMPEMWKEPGRGGGGSVLDANYPPN